MSNSPDRKPAERRSFLPDDVPKERWGLLMPAAVALALLLMLGIVVVRFSA